MTRVALLLAAVLCLAGLLATAAPDPHAARSGPEPPPLPPRPALPGDLSPPEALPPPCGDPTVFAPDPEASAPHGVPDLPGDRAGAAGGEECDEPIRDVPFEESLGEQGADSGEGPGGIRAGGDGDRATPVDSALQWLVDHQAREGFWPADGVHRHPLSRWDEEPEPESGDAARTGLAVLAFLGAGETHKHGRAKKTVREGLRYLKSAQRPDGGFGEAGDPLDALDDALGGLAMAEAYAFTASPLFRQSATLGLRHLLEAPLPATSASFWTVLAWKSGAASKLPLPDRAEERVRDFLIRADGGLPGLLPPDSHLAQRAAVALGWRLVGETPGGSELLARAQADVAAQPPSPGTAGDIAGLYFGTAAVFHEGGEAFTSWRSALWRELDFRQIRDGPERGSFEATGRDAAVLGRAGTAALAALASEFSFHYVRVGSR